MIVSSHHFIANAVYAYLSMDQTLSLDRRSFLFGNIKPDFLPSCKCRHTLASSLDWVISQAERLGTDNLPRNVFSMRLGEMCHYISDCFCICHFDDQSYDQLIPHLLYETRLHLPQPPGCANGWLVQ